MLDNKGQAFEAYRLLIDAILALLVLVIIVSAVNYLESLKTNISSERFYTGLKNAVKQPN